MVDAHRVQSGEGSIAKLDVYQEFTLEGSRVNATADQINTLTGINGNVQEQLDAKGTSNVSVISDLGDGFVNLENNTVYLGLRPSENNTGSSNSA